MYQQITMYRTKDGQTFDTEHQAENHVTTIVCDRLAAIVKQAAPNIKFKEQTAIAQALFDNYIVVQGYLSMIDFGNEDDEPEQD